jgi:hypothetical protein
MNPRLNLRATENIKSTVNGDSGDGRSVEFVCGVVVTKTLNDMGLEFVIDAPEDMTISNQLQSMTKEGRGKVAVTMLTTGMYLADGNTSGFTMTGPECISQQPDQPDLGQGIALIGCELRHRQLIQ